MILVHFNEAGVERAKQEGREKDSTLERMMRPQDLGRAAAPAFLPGTSRGQRSLAGSGPQGRKELYATE